jgi:16S rRNA U516 pseudouridylate synthase RsuA-like enzyme
LPEPGISEKCEFFEVDLPVKSLKRTRIGKLTVRGLGIGKFRTLTNAEVAYLRKRQK